MHLRPPNPYQYYVLNHLGLIPLPPMVMPLLFLNSLIRPLLPGIQILMYNLIVSQRLPKQVQLMCQSSMNKMDLNTCYGTHDLLTHHSESWLLAGLTIKKK